MIAPPRGFAGLNKARCGSGSRWTALFEWRDKRSSARGVPALVLSLPGRAQRHLLAQSQLREELIKGYGRRQLWLELRFPAIVLLKSKDMLKVIEGKHSRVVLAGDEVLREIAAKGMLGYLAQVTRSFPLQFQYVFGVLGSRY